MTLGARIRRAEIGLREVGLQTGTHMGTVPRGPRQHRKENVKESEDNGWAVTIEVTLSFFWGGGVLPADGAS